MPFTGNPVAVVFDTEGLDSDRMQQIARWTNLSETTFVTKPSASDYSLRIFTPGGELPFAGHPSLGSAFAVAHGQGLLGSKLALTQHCGVGDVNIEINTEKSSVRLKLPSATLSGISSQAAISLSHALGCELTDAPKIVDLGPRWLTVPVRSEEELLALKPNQEAIAALSRELAITGVNLYGPSSKSDQGNQFELRTFAPAVGVAEDPVCGSGNGAVAYYLRDHVKTDLAEHHAKQGRAIGRDGKIHVQYEGLDIWLGGTCINTVIGQITG